MSGYLDSNNTALAASVIVNALSLTMSYLTLSFSFTLSALVGGALGQGNI
jgi:Na+-driven multidrug efflux pump